MAETKFPLAIVIRAVDQATAPVRKIAERIDRFAAPVRQLTARFQALGEAAGLPRVAGALAGAGSAVVGFGREVAGVLLRTTALAGAAAAGVFALVRAWATAGDETREAAARIGIGVEALQELRFAAGRAGLEAGEFDKALLGMGKRLGEARVETGSLFTLLSRLDPALLAQLVRTRDQGQAFRLLTGYLHDTTDAQTRLAVASAAFGRAGTQLLALTEGGVEGLDAMARRARELGVIIGEEDTRAAEQFADATDDLFAGLLGLRNLIAAALAPVLRELIETALAWVQRVRPQIQAFAREFAAGLPERIALLVEWFRRAAEQAQPLIAAGGWLIETFGAVNVLVGVLAVAIGGPLLSALVALAPAIYAVGAALLTTPLGWFIGLVAAAIAIGWAFYDAWDEIMGFVSALWSGLVDGIAAAVRGLERLLGLAPVDVGLGGGRGPAGAPGRAGSDFFAAAGARDAGRDDRVRVEFENVPPGVRVVRERGDAVDLDVGYSMAPA